LGTLQCHIKHRISQKEARDGTAGSQAVPLSVVMRREGKVGGDETWPLGYGEDTSFTSMASGRPSINSTITPLKPVPSLVELPVLVSSIPTTRMISISLPSAPLKCFPHMMKAIFGVLTGHKGLQVPAPPKKPTKARKAWILLTNRCSPTYIPGAFAGRKLLAPPKLTSCIRSLRLPQDHVRSTSRADYSWPDSGRSRGDRRLGFSHQMEEHGAINQPYGFVPRKVFRVIGEVTTRHDVDLVCPFGIEQAEHFANRPHGDLSRLPLLALNEHGLAVFSCDDINPAVRSRTGVSYDRITVPSVCLTDEFFETPPGQITNAGETRLPFEQLTPSPGKYRRQAPDKQKEKEDPYGKRGDEPRHSNKDQSSLDHGR
jgi:hypothetical protein